jgi:hypothetical protein
MSISRRRFLRAGSVAALAAAVPLKGALSVAGQGIRKDRDGNPSDGVPDGIVNSPLFYYTKAAFSSYLNSTFLVQAVALGTIEVTLTQVRDTASGSVASQAGQECFSLLFQSRGSSALRQGTYGIEHAALGSFALFLVPGGPEANGGQSYVAIVNRLAESPALFAAPARSVKTSTSPGPNENVSTSVKATPAAPTAPPRLKVPKKRRQGEEGFDIISLDK